MKNIEVYTDGSSLGNPGPGGWGAVFVENNNIIQELGGCDSNTTNNKMELQAAIETLKYLSRSSHINDKEVVIFTDSSYVLNGITSWVFNWEKNGWKTADKKEVMNQEIWKELICLVRNFNGKINWQKVKGHSGHIFNDKADEIATSCASSQIGVQHLSQ